MVTKITTSKTMLIIIACTGGNGVGESMEVALVPNRDNEADDMLSKCSTTSSTLNRSIQAKKTGGYGA